MYDEDIMSFLILVRNGYLTVFSFSIPFGSIYHTRIFILGTMVIKYAWIVLDSRSCPNLSIFLFSSCIDLIGNMGETCN